MLAELRVAQLGVIEELTIVFGPGMTVLTGETGAGKTLIVDAISLLLGGRADPMLVRPGANEALVEGRFAGTFADHEPDAELILARVIPASGRARAYVDGRMAGAQQLAERGIRLVDLHGQHAHQSLLHPAAQRAALDANAEIDASPLAAARRQIRALRAAQAELGGDSRARARELDLLHFQVAELDAAGLISSTEDEELRLEEEQLSEASAWRAAAARTADSVSGDDGMIDRLGAAVSGLNGPAPLSRLHERLLAVQAELSDIASDARAAIEVFVDDPERLARVSTRRRVLSELRRKYGDSLSDVIAFQKQARARITELEAHDDRAACLERQQAEAEAEQRQVEARIGAARRASAPGFATAVESVLAELAMPRARFGVNIGPDQAGEEVSWLLGANPGEAMLPLAKVASGGELARTMLAVRLVLTDRKTDRRPPGGATSRSAVDEEEVEDPPTLVFDEIDAGIGGEAAVAVGRALAALADQHQVLVVTHLPQVAAFADRHFVVRKRSGADRTSASVEAVEGPARVVELSRMLSGRPDSPTARRHAEELLAQRGAGHA
jgi:DNA repair protein RecN (Recombination protein N)